MTPQQVAQSYDQIASVWSSDDFHRANGIPQHERAIRFCGNKDSDNGSSTTTDTATTTVTAIDIGCGSSGRIIDLLLQKGFAAEGLDISTEMLKLAKQRHPEVTFHQADICTWEFPRQYDFISAWDSIWHAPLAEHEQILRKLCDALNTGGVLIFTSGGVDQPGDTTNPCEGQPMYHAALGIPKLLEVISQQGCVCRHLEYDQFPELHVYFIVQKSI